MEIVGIGTDIIECLRVGRMIEEHAERFLTRVYTSHEIRHCQGRKRPTEQLAARWAGKEAVLKALGTRWRRGLCWTDIELRTEKGKPRVVLTGTVKELAQELRVADFLVSLAHCRAYATAYVLAVRDGTPGYGK